MKFNIKLILILLGIMFLYMNRNTVDNFANVTLEEVLNKVNTLQASISDMKPTVDNINAAFTFEASAIKPKKYLDAWGGGQNVGGKEIYVDKKICVKDVHGFNCLTGGQISALTGNRDISLKSMKNSKYLDCNKDGRDDCHLWSYSDSSDAIKFRLHLR